MHAITQTKFWLYGLATVLVVMLPVLYIPLYIETSSRMVLVLNGMGLLASLLALLLHYIPKTGERKINEALVGMVLIIGWSVSLALLLWSDHKEANLFLNLLNKTLFPITAIVLTGISWQKPIPEDRGIWVIIVLVLVLPVVIDVSNLAPLSLNAADLVGLQFLSGILLLISLVVTARERTLHSKHHPLQLAFLIFTCVHWVTYAMGDLMPKSIPELTVFFALTRSVAVFVLALQILNHFLLTPMMQKQRNLEESERAYTALRRVVDQIPAGILWKDKNSVFVGANSYFLNAIGFDEEADLIGLSEYDLRQGNAEEFLSHDRAVFSTGKASLETYERYRLPGERIAYNRISRAPLRDVNGNIEGIVAFFTEVEQIDEKGKIYRAESLLNEHMHPYLGYGKLFTLPEHPEDITDEHAKNYVDNLKFDD